VTKLCVKEDVERVACDKIACKRVVCETVVCDKIIWEEKNIFENCVTDWTDQNEERYEEKGNGKIFFKKYDTITNNGEINNLSK
jgi:hypothetical protein